MPLEKECIQTMPELEHYSYLCHEVMLTADAVGFLTH